jgi:CRISPR-associated protein Csd1
MISELLDLARRLEIPTPRPFRKLPVHYFIELDGAGNLLGFTPAFGSTKEKTAEPELGKMVDCPVYFPLKLKSPTEPEIQARGGGGKSVAEAGHGDIKEIFCTQIRTPKGKPPVIAEIPAPAGKQLIDATDGEEIDPDDEDEETETKPGKDQHYRHSGWLDQMSGYIDSANCKGTEPATAIKMFADAKHRLTSDAVLALFNLPEPEKAGAAATGEEEKKKAKAEATKAKNAQLKVISKARFTFRVNGRVLLNDAGFKNWWEQTYAMQRMSILAKLPIGDDGYGSHDDDASQRLTPVFPHIPGVPNGGMYCPMASFDKAATKSFGLGKHTLSLSLKTSEQSAAALIWLLQDSSSHCKLGDKLVAVFWAVPAQHHGKPLPLDFASALNEPDALQVRDFFNNIHGHAAATPASAQFYCAILSSPKSRITVRSWHTETLHAVTQKADAYFHAVSLPNFFRGGASTASTIRELADALAPAKGKSGPPPPAYAQILETALFGRLLPHSFLESAIARQSIELAKGKAQDDKFNDFESRLRARTALIKLYFQINHRITMNETTHQSDDHLDAYRCGQVLAVFDKIHNEAHGQSTASSPAGRYYGSASSTPALVFPRLCKLARIHLEKIQNGHTAGRLDLRLTSLIAAFSSRASWPRTLSLEQQGQFAIGFYYERAQS